MGYPLPLAALFSDFSESKSVRYFYVWLNVDIFGAETGYSLPLAAPY